MIRASKNQQGFTLIEVAIAVFILGLALTTLIGLQTRIVSLYVEERNITKASLYAQYIMSRIESEAGPQEEGTVSGDLDSRLRKIGYFDDLPSKDDERDELKGWQYEINVLKIDLYPFEAPLRRIDLKVSWGAGEDFSLVYFQYDFNSQRRLPEL